MLSTAMICTVSYIFGVIISTNVSFTTLVFFSVCMASAYTIYVIITKQFNFLIPLVTLFIVFGGLRCYSAFQNKLYYEFPDKYVTITGTIYSNPSISSGEYKYKYILRAEKVSYRGEAYSINSKIFINTKKEVNFGDLVSVSGFLKEIKGRENEYGYDFSAYYKSLGIYARLTALEMSIDGETHSLMPSFLSGKLKSIMFNNIRAHYSGDEAAYLYAIILGDKSNFSDSCKTLLTKTGIMHTLYSPFVHISFIMLLAGLMCRKNKRYTDTAVFFMLIVYALINSGSPVILKASLLALVVLLNKGIFGYYDKTEMLSIIVLVSTVIEPLLCFNSAFMMSVISTFLVCVSFTPIYEKMTPFFYRFHIPQGAPRQIIVIWIIFSVGTLPFAAYYFNGFSLYSILMTPLLMPFVFIVLALSPVLFILPFSLPISSVLNFSLKILEKAPYFLQKLPLSYIMLRTPELIDILIFYLGWWIFLRFCKRRLHTPETKILALIMCAFIICSISNYSFGALDIYFVNVGQGDGAVLHTGIGETVLIDGGGSADYQEDYNIGESIYLPYLVSHGFTNIDMAIVSHYHKDHAEGIIAAAENLKINTLVMPDTMPDNIYRKKLEDIAERKNIKIEYLIQSDEIHFRSGLVLKVLAPDINQLNGNDENDTSLVIEADFGKIKALFTGDSSDEADNSYPADIDILKASHHGSQTASSDAFVNYTRPKYTVISVGKDNSYNLPNSAVLRRFYKVGSHILRTDEQGDIHFRLNKNGGIKYRTLTGVY